MTPLDGEHAPGWFFQAQDDWLVPAPIAKGSWGNTLRGRLLGGLVGRDVELFRTDHSGFRCARLTIDMFRPPLIRPLRTETSIVRDGNRIKVLETTILQEDGPIGQGKSVLLLEAEQPRGPFREPPPWGTDQPLSAGARLRATQAVLPATWDTWVAEGTSGWSEGAWMRETYRLVAGEDLTPLVSLAVLADTVSPVGNWREGGSGFINADYTVYLGREPRGQHFGFQPYGHVSESGVAAACCAIHDLTGPIGFVATAALANDRARAVAKQ